MPAPYLHLDLEERRKIARWRDAKVPATEIALRLGRHRSTIFRELSRNRFVDAELQHLSGYYALNAQTIATDRRANLRKMVRHPALRTAVIDRLRAGWTPEQIAGRLRLDAFRKGSATRRSTNMPIPRTVMLLRCGSICPTTAASVEVVADVARNFIDLLTKYPSGIARRRSRSAKPSGLGNAI